MNSVTASFERIATKVRMWRYEEQATNQARGERDARERLQIARVSRLH